MNSFLEVRRLINFSFVNKFITVLVILCKSDITQITIYYLSSCKFVVLVFTINIINFI